MHQPVLFSRMARAHAFSEFRDDRAQYKQTQKRTDRRAGQLFERVEHEDSPFLRADVPASPPTALDAEANMPRPAAAPPPVAREVV